MEVPSASASREGQGTPPVQRSLGPSLTEKAIARVVLAHMLAYPVALAWAIAALPYFIVQLGARALTEDERVIGDLIAWRSLIPAGVAGALAHIVAIPWWRRPDRRTGLVLVIGDAVIFALAVIVGACGWVYIVTR